MKSILYTLSILLLLATVAISQTKYTWTGGSGSWQTASNWTPNGIPGGADTAVINNGTVTNDSSVNVAGLFHNGGTINGVGNLIIADKFNFIAGTQSGTGTTTIASGATLDFLSSSPKTISRTIVVDDGLLRVIGAGPVSISSGGQLVNNGTVDIQNSNSFGSADGSITNNGNFTRSLSTGTATIGAPFTNNGTITVFTGTLLINNITGSGSFNISSGAKFRISSGTSTLGGSSITGEGVFEVVGGTLNFSGNDVVVSNTTTFRQAGGTIGGSGNLVIDGFFNFETGTQSGTGTTTIASGATLDFLSSSPKTISRTIVVDDGLLRVIGAGPVSISSGGQLVNNGTVDIQNSNSFGSADGSITNNGNFTRSLSTGTATIGAPFTNNGTIEILTGELKFSSSLNNTLQGTIKGVGIITPGSNITNDGTVSPGTSPGVLRVSGNYPQSQNANLNIEIGGYTAGTERDSLSVSQQAQLNGTLNIVFINNFTPQIGDVFPFLSYQSRSGEFTQVNFPNNVTGYIQYLSNRAQIVIDTATSVNEDEIEELDSEQNKIPTTYELSQNFPNPFNPSTNIRYSVPERSSVMIKIYDILGREVTTLVNEEKDRGVYLVNFDASGLASGIYLYRIQAGSFVETKKMILLR